MTKTHDKVLDKTMKFVVSSENINVMAISCPYFLVVPESLAAAIWLEGPSGCGSHEISGERGGE